MLKVGKIIMEKLMSVLISLGARASRPQSKERAGEPQSNTRGPGVRSRQWKPRECQKVIRFDWDFRFRQGRQRVRLNSRCPRKGAKLAPPGDAQAYCSSLDA